MASMTKMFGAGFKPVTKAQIIAAPKTAPPPKDAATNAAFAAARAKAANIKTLYSLKHPKTWEDFEALVGLKVPEHLKFLEVTFMNATLWGEWYVNDTPNRIAKAREDVAVVSEAPKVAPIWQGGNLLPFNLPPPCVEKPQQRKAYAQIMYELWGEHPNHSYSAILPLKAGKGKTIIAGMVIRNLQDNNYYGHPNFGVNVVLYLVPNKIKLSTIQKLKMCGVKNVGSEVQVISYSELRSKKWKHWFQAYEGTLFNEQHTFYRYPLSGFFPALIICDECHVLKKLKTKTTRYVMAFTERQKYNTRWLGMSATPAAKVNDLSLLTVASRKQVAGEEITRENWPTMSRIICQADPDKPNKAAMKRLRDWYGPAIVNPPNDPQKFKSYNDIVLLEFKTEAERKFYKETEDRWLDVCERLGKVVNEQGAVMAMHTMMQVSEETLKAPYFAERAQQHWLNGKAPVIAVRFQDTVRRVVEHLAKLGWTRDRISVIWGGEKEIKVEDTYPIDRWATMMARLHDAGDDYKIFTREEAAKFRRTTKFLQNRWKPNETAEQQAERNKWLSKMGLFAQTAEQTFQEVENFQDGKTELCIYTLSSGGTGIDLDHQRDHVRPREVDGTICYYTEQFVQFLGRCYRVVTKSDVYQHMLFFKGTILATHTAPLLAKKLGSMNAFAETGVNLEEELLNAAISGKLRREYSADDEKLITAQHEVVAAVPELLDAEDKDDAPSDDDSDDDTESTLVDDEDTEQSTLL